MKYLLPVPDFMCVMPGDVRCFWAAVCQGEDEAPPSAQEPAHACEGGGWADTTCQGRKHKPIGIVSVKFPQTADLS